MITIFNILLNDFLIIKRSIVYLHIISGWIKKLSVYTVWCNKAGSGKSLLVKNISMLYAMNNPNDEVIVIDLCFLWKDINDDVG